MKEIQLGDKVKDIHCGFTGVTVARTEFINGCVQWMVLPKVGKENKIPEEIGLDSQSLVVILRGEKGKEIDKIEKEKEKRKLNNTKKQIIEALEENNTGGPMTKGIQMRGF